ncbi:hypothetical protein JCM10450v2_002190 [Rhodotorula kratochvilovae]
MTTLGVDDTQPANTVEGSSSRFKVFPPGVALKWDARTESQAMLRLVEKREAVFAKQREANSPALQARSEALASAHIASKHPVLAGNVAAYKRFCALVDAPPFPLTHAMLALAMYARCSAADGHFATFRGDLLGVRRATEEVWTGGGRVYEEACAFDTDGEALEEFMKEKRDFTSTGTSSRLWHDRPTRSRPSYVNANVGDSENKPAGSDDDEDDDEGASRSYQQVATLGLPQPGDSFPSVDAVEQAVVRALVPVYGASSRIERRTADEVEIRCNRFHYHYDTSRDGRCFFLHRVERDAASERWVVHGAESRYEHDHDPDPRIVADPSWRPLIKKPLAREALGLSPLVPKRGRKRKVEEAEENEGSEADEVVRAPPSVRVQRPALAAARVPDSTARAALRTSPLLSPSKAASFPSPIAAFLAALHPSLSPLAPYLHASGLTSPVALADLVLLEPATLDRLRETVRGTKAPRGGRLPSVVQMKLLARVLGDAREAGWPEE